ncbi:helix-turn-helix transcriptional regulator [Streptacidiphilus sp. P02-A3a]|uniref:helix-turn-helix transcriptional regulator n=1 Tax=Streptacidiphilus sp. P02-A3a TaxID=2704468 RepID=UPI0015F8DBB8|nr:helix-turn-helix transcriptional regulator [Streptacidiphilus sp. P02-A3a]QMU67375.1 helix-turn-helix transcriptional regulator [Streptacidiphilus sp. P02-A3a]
MDRADDLIPDLDELAVAAYRRLLEEGCRDDEWLSERADVPLERVDEVYRLLSSLQVVKAHTERDWLAVEPHVAMANLVLPMEAEVRRRAAQAERLRTQLQMLVPVHESVTGTRSQQTFEIIGDEALAELLDLETGRCAQEMLLLQPDTESSLIPWERYAGRCRDALRRGVGLRAVHQHGARFHLPTEGLVDTLSADGARFRTVDELPAQLVLFDRRCALLLVTAEWGAQAEARSEGAGVAVVVRHPAVISVLSGIFATSWDRGTPFTTRDPRPSQVTDQVKRSILFLLASGAKDDVVARRLGLSVRTCRRHISDLMSSLGVSSRFQAGVEAGARGLVPALGRAAEPGRRAAVSSAAE